MQSPMSSLKAVWVKTWAVLFKGWQWSSSTDWWPLCCECPWESVWDQYYWALLSAVWMLGWTNSSDLQVDTLGAQLLFRRISITWRKRLMETSKLNRHKHQVLHLDWNNPMEWCRLGEQLSREGPGSWRTSHLSQAVLWLMATRFSEALGTLCGTWQSQLWTILCLLSLSHTHPLLAAPQAALGLCHTNPCVWLILGRTAAAGRGSRMGLTASACSAPSHLGSSGSAQGTVCYLLSSSTREVTSGRGYHNSSSKSNAVSQVQAKFISRSSPNPPSISINRDKGRQRSREVQNSITSFCWCSQMFPILQSSPRWPCQCVHQTIVKVKEQGLAWYKGS